MTLRHALRSRTTSSCPLSRSRHCRRHGRGRAGCHADACDSAEGSADPSSPLTPPSPPRSPAAPCSGSATPPRRPPSRRPVSTRSSRMLVSTSSGPTSVAARRPSRPSAPTPSTSAPLKTSRRCSLSGPAPTSGSSRRESRRCPQPPGLRARHRPGRRRQVARGPRGQEDRLLARPGAGRACVAGAGQGRAHPGRCGARRDAECRRRLRQRGRQQAGRRGPAGRDPADPVRREVREGRRHLDPDRDPRRPEPALRARRRPSRTQTRRPRWPSTSSCGPRPSSGSTRTPTSTPRRSTSTTRG